MAIPFFGGGVNYSKTKGSHKPWGPTIEPLKDIVGEGKRLYESNLGTKYYPGNTVSPFSPNQLKAHGAIAGTAGTSPVAADSVDALRRILNPATNPFSSVRDSINPYASKLFGLMAENIGTETSSAFARGGRFGSTAHANTIADNLSDAGTRFYGNIYGSALNADIAGAQGQASSTLGALNAAPATNALRYADARELERVGDKEQSQAQRLLTDDVNRYNFEQHAPYSKLGAYSDLVRSIAGLGGSSRGSTFGANASVSGGGPAPLTGAQQAQHINELGGGLDKDIIAKLRGFFGG